jgi:heat shock protein HslJ
MTRVEAYVTTAVILLAALAAAASRASAQTAGNSWVLEKGQGVATVKGSPASLTLDDKQMSGSTGCNTFRATIADRPDKRVAISDVTLTRKLCAPQANNNERAIVQAFSKTEFVEQGPGTLTFLSGKREPLLVWKTAEKAAAPDGSARAAMMPPLPVAKAQAAPKRVTKAKLARNEHRARATKASRKRDAHRRAKHSRIAHVSRRCRCVCGWWN